MEQVGSPEQVLADVRIKEDRVRAFLEREGLDALVLGRQDNFAWLTAGGDNRVVTTSEMGFGYLVVTPDRKWLVSHSMDGQRFIEEQVPGQGYELVTSYWHQASPEQKALNLTRGMAVGADFALEGARLYGPELVDLHYPLTDLEIERCRWIGGTAHRILTQVAHDLEPGVTEQEVAARLLYEYALAGMTIDVLIVGFDNRIRDYRHPMPAENVLERYALLHPAARRWGLHANVTRLVHFGEAPSNTRRAMDGVAAIGAHVAAMLAPGVPFADILTEQIRLYRVLGYSSEWIYHFQGGITGYTLADPTRCRDPEARVVERQAYDYFITITAAKFEELMLLTENGIEFASMGPGWPVRTVETPHGVIDVPDVLIR
ncbi:MAG: M24 family metallopeptidase [Anaerolineae bacterium]|jgi:antitoxin VapB